MVSTDDTALLTVLLAKHITSCDNVFLKGYKSFLFIRCVSRSHLSLKSAPNLRRAPVKRSGFTSVTSEDCTEEEDTFGELPAGDF